MAIMEINPGRWTADIDGDFVVFLIGAEVRDAEHAGPAAGLLMAMVDMLEELMQDPAKGLLGFQRFGGVGGVIVQYWRSFEALEAYAKNPSAKHAPVWRQWNRLGEDERSGAGIWHETYLVPARHYEAIYQNMPVTGLQRAGTAITVNEARASARQRLGA
jgi:fumigallin biosynthesis monooxygenase-like protein